jgi:hypothetical protein
MVPYHDILSNNHHTTNYNTYREAYIDLLLPSSLEMFRNIELSLEFTVPSHHVQ